MYGEEDWGDVTLQGESCGILSGGRRSLSQMFGDIKLRLLRTPYVEFGLGRPVSYTKRKRENSVYYFFFRPSRRWAKISRQVMSNQLSKPAILGVKYT